MEKAVIETVLFLIKEETGINIEADGCGSSLYLEYGIDSLCMTNIVLAIEDVFAIEISDRDSEKLSSINDIVGFIQHIKATDIKSIQQNLAKYKERNKRRGHSTIQNTGLSTYFLGINRQLA